MGEMIEETPAVDGAAAADTGDQPSIEQSGLLTPEQFNEEIDRQFQQRVQWAKAEGFLPYEPGELERLHGEIDRQTRLEAYETDQENQAFALERLADTITGWHEELGAQVDPQQVINLAGQMVAEAEQAGYRLDDDVIMAHVRRVAEQLAVADQGDRMIDDQIEREGNVLGLTADEHRQVRRYAEELFPRVAEHRGTSDLVAAREAVSVAARVIAGQPGRAAEPASLRVQRFGRQAEELRRAGVAKPQLPPAEIVNLLANGGQS